MRGKSCALLWCEAEVFKKAQTRHVRSSFGSSLVENLHSIVARTACARKGWNVAKVFVFPICWAMGLRKVEKYARRSGGRGAIWRDERGKKRGRFCGEVELEVKSQEAKSASCPEQFWKFICWKTAWHCGAKAMRNAEGKIRKSSHLRNTIGS